ncbi:MAG: Ig-like domain-containing protein, partial [Gemmatimonadetes bacterium]|nr:Ig-like domain-containing protein [Gemmatimonadota bacterium]
ALAIGATAALAATAYDAQGNVLTGRTVTWTSSDGRIVGFEAGSTIRGIAEGTARVTATVEGASAAVRVTVLPPNPVVTRLVVQPDTLSLAPGATGALRATAYDARGNVMTGHPVAWASSASAVATVSGGTVTAVAAGTAEVVATVDGISASAQVRVRAYRAVASIKVWPDSLIMDQGDSRLISASTYDSNGSVSGRTVTYTSSNSAVAKLDANWKVVAVAPGTARIIASSEGVEAYIGVRVVAVPTGPAGGYTIEKISGDGQTAEFGQELPLQLVVRVLRAGYPIANAQVTWTADSGSGFVYTYPNTGKTDANGRATIRWYMGAKEGTQTATASVEGGASVQYTATGVRAAYGGEVNSIQINPGMTWLEPGMSSSMYGAALKDSKAARWAVLEWTVDNPGVLAVRIEPEGVSWSNVYFTALKVGEATFTARSGTLTRSITVKVFPPGSTGGGGGGGSAARAAPE